MQIKQVIDSHNESWASVAKKLNKTSSAIIQIADGNPTVGKLKELAGVIGCHWLDFFADELEADGLMIVSHQSQPEQPESSASEDHNQEADNLPFDNNTNIHQQPSAQLQQAIVCPHCHRALVLNIASYEQK